MFLIKLLLCAWGGDIRIRKIPPTFARKTNVWKEGRSYFAAEFCLLQLIAKAAHLGNGQDESVGRG